MADTSSMMNEEAADFEISRSKPMMRKSSPPLMKSKMMLDKKEEKLERPKMAMKEMNDEKSKDQEKAPVSKKMDKAKHKADSDDKDSSKRNVAGGKGGSRTRPATAESGKEANEAEEAVEVKPEPKKADAKRPQSPTSKPQEPNDEPEPTEAEQELEEEESDIRDYTSVATQMDALMENFDPDGALRPTIVKWGDDWTRRFQKGLLLDEEVESFDLDKQKTARGTAFDLLDCLSRSGGLALSADIQIVVAATHCFTKSLIDCVVQDSINPIEKLERSSLIVATTIHQKPAEEVVNPHVLERVKTYTPALFV